ncbi:MAG TPA: Ig-like domain-containing protein, partial [Myxococcota bacterium]|nr:Ig-like domain-containing protein [Myxococcota bacterium]
MAGLRLNVRVVTERWWVVRRVFLLGLALLAMACEPYSISGTITPSSLGGGTVLTLSLTGPAQGSLLVSADSSGNYTFTNLANGTYTVTPNKTGERFIPASQTVTISGDSFGSINFLAEAQSPAGNYPDLSDIIPTATAPTPFEPTPFSIAGTGANRQLQFTHDTYNGGSGPLEILPVYNPASGNYQGFQHIYSFQSGTWTLVQTIPVAGVFVFDAAHGHFHFPFTSYVLCAVNANGSIGAPVALSTKNDYCINDSFIYNPSLPNAGTWPNLGSCNDPTSLRGLSIGGADEYDQTDPGQTITIGNLADGTYWLRAMVDPDDYFAESDKTNNETDIELAIAGTKVTVLQSVQPKLTQPPAITLTSPAAGNVSGTVQLTASTAAGTGVQFLLDGLPFGSVVPNPPYNLPWDTTTVPNGSHWLAAQTTDSTGHAGTSPVVLVTAANNATIPPTVQLLSPAAGSTVNAVITLSATATAQIGVPSVQFYVDNVALGSPVTAPPFMTTWDTQTVTNGAHVLSAVATDQSGLAGSSSPVSVTVDNSHPANPIGFDAQLSQDGSNTLQTAAFSTTTTSDLLVAFVAYDGPTSVPQTATVSGGGVLWQLLKRSNTQFGTAEIWAAKATDFLTSVTVSAQPGITGYHGSLTVIAFTNASGPGIVGQASAPTGAPDIYLPGVSAGNWVFAVGNDWDKAIARTPVSGQVLVHQDVDKVVGDTFWVQSTTAPSTAD